MQLVLTRAVSVLKKYIFNYWEKWTLNLISIVHVIWFIFEFNYWNIQWSLFIIYLINSNRKIIEPDIYLIRLNFLFVLILFYFIRVLIDGDDGRGLLDSVDRIDGLLCALGRCFDGLGVLLGIKDRSGTGGRIFEIRLFMLLGLRTRHSFLGLARRSRGWNRRNNHRANWIWARGIDRSFMLGARLLFFGTQQAIGACWVNKMRAISSTHHL